MDNNQMPANISYVFLIHGGSYKEFISQLSTRFPRLKIVATKVVSTHYYVVEVTEEGKDSYSKKELYTLPLMAMREEFSNFLFFKKIKAYNNALKYMCDGNHNQSAPYDLFIAMLTGVEKYKFANIGKEVKSIEYNTLSDEHQTIHTSVFGETIHKVSTFNDLFKCVSLKVDGQEIDFQEIIKKQKLTVGVL